MADDNSDGSAGDADDRETADETADEGGEPEGGSSGSADGADGSSEGAGETSEEGGDSGEGDEPDPDSASESGDEDVDDDAGGEPDAEASGEGADEGEDVSDDEDGAAEASDVSPEEDEEGEGSESEKEGEKGESGGASDETEEDGDAQADGAGSGGAGSSTRVTGSTQIAGVFVPERERDTAAGETHFLSEEDLGEFETQETNPMTWILSIVVFALVGVLLFVLFNQTKQGDRIVALFKGELKAYERAEAQRQREEFKQAQLSKLPKYGTLKLRGRPKYSTVKLDGELQYGKLSHPPRERGEVGPGAADEADEGTSGEGTDQGGEESTSEPKKKKKELPDKLKKGADGGGGEESESLVVEWTPLRLTRKTEFQNLLVDEKHKVEVQAPGFRSKTWNLTEGMWNKVAGSDIQYEKRLQVDLVPKSAKRMLEFEQRLVKDPEENYFGEITVETVPKGAKVIFDTYPLLDEDGEELRTPVTFDKYYIRNKETDELEERKIQVDTPPDRGHKIQIRVPEDRGDYPKYVQGLERQMWTCDWKDEAEPGRLPEGDTPLPEMCNYKYEVDVDFNGLKNFIRRKEKEKKELKKEHDNIRRELKEMREKLKKL